MEDKETTDKGEAEEELILNFEEVFLPAEETSGVQELVKMISGSSEIDIGDNSEVSPILEQVTAEKEPEYIPPQSDMETESAETAHSYKCSICSFTSEGIIYVSAVLTP